ncbi:hypothetical protein BBJ28_00007163 [Nothophytophthora sp. Chile5]|nr:hypothetical protein BBJ28_00007163 [Nothophytophthora sp. Chile5]
MLNRPSLPSLQRFPLDDGLPGLVGRSNAVMPTPVSTSCSNHSSPNVRDWRAGGDEELRRLRSSHVVLIERMLRNHQPHDVLSHVPENTDWRSKTFKLALKIERLMFRAAKSRADYMDDHTLQRRVKILCRYLVRIRMRKNAATDNLTKRC